VWIDSPTCPVLAQSCCAHLPPSRQLIGLSSRTAACHRPACRSRTRPSNADTTRIPWRSAFRTRADLPSGAQRRLRLADADTVTVGQSRSSLPALGLTVAGNILLVPALSDFFLEHDRPRFPAMTKPTPPYYPEILLVQLGEHRPSNSYGSSLTQRSSPVSEQFVGVNWIDVGLFQICQDGFEER
jgi:hypothetical protein